MPVNAEIDDWRVLLEEPITYPYPVNWTVYFEKLISIWREKCQTVNRRLAGTVLVEYGSDCFLKVMNNIVHLHMDYIDDRAELRKLIPKDAKFSANCYELSYFIEDTSVIFLPIMLDPAVVEAKHSHVPVPYKIVYQIVSETSARISISVPCATTSQESHWLEDTVFEVLKKWAQKLDLKKGGVMTNRHMELEEYTKLYRRMKEMWGKPILENWKESTDPKKFVYEDCGIATYLLEFWRIRSIKPKLFADLGCGNGLLVHLLNKENVNGVGLDIRERKIWKDQFSMTDLREIAVDPTQPGMNLPEGVDYLIGNHSDELTPWMPIMAARLNCGFFVLPCCAFDLQGKYRARKNDKNSQYQSFLNYVREIATRLGFKVEEDRLSIPSTKKFAFIGTVPEQGLVPNVQKVIEELIAEQTGGLVKPFISRPKTEPIVNCLNIPVDKRDEITKRLFDYLLEAGKGSNSHHWRYGAVVPLGNLSELLTEEEKLMMKQQNGGLQTFLRNQHQVFQVAMGMAKLRTEFLKKAGPNAKKTPCWMEANHPDGCFRREKDCRYKHDKPDKADEYYPSTEMEA